MHAKGPKWTPDNHSCVHPATATPENEDLVSAAPDLLEVAEGSNGMESIYLNEVLRIAGPDAELTHAAQSRLHTLRQQRYAAIAKARGKESQ